MRISMGVIKNVSQRFWVAAPGWRDFRFDDIDTQKIDIDGLGSQRIYDRFQGDRYRSG